MQNGFAYKKRQNGIDYSENEEIQNINSEIRNRKNLQMNTQTSESAESCNKRKRQPARCIKTAVCNFKQTGDNRENGGVCNEFSAYGKNSRKKADKSAGGEHGICARADTADKCRRERNNLL